jgi:hypothetical protein
VLSLNTIRELMGEDGADMSDADLEALRGQLYGLAADVLDMAAAAGMMKAPPAATVVGAAPASEDGGPR